MAGVFPTRKRPFYTYLPVMSIASLFWWITGLGLWIHFTQTARINSQNLIDILGLTLSGGPTGAISRIYQSMIATSVVYAIFAVLMHALGLWRALIEQKQDAGGEVDEEDHSYLLWCNVLIQIAWWCIVLWEIVLGVGFGAYAGYIYVFKSAMTNTLLLQALSGGPPPTPPPGFCPLQCLDVTSTGLFSYSRNQAQQVVFCVCDQPTLLAANSAVQAAYNAVPGMLVGMLLMTVYGVVLLVYLTSMLVRVNMEQGISDRLEQQGFVVGGTVAVSKPAPPPQQQQERLSQQQQQQQRARQPAPQRPLLR